MNRGTVLPWLGRNELWLGAVAGAGATVAIFKDSIRSMVRRASAEAKRRRSEGAPLDLRFVPIEGRCFWGIGRRGTESVMQIETDWYVTNNSPVPARLVSARLVKPRVDDPKGLNLIDGASALGRTHSSHFVIPPGESWHVSIGFHIGPPSQKAGKPLRVEIAVTDQFGGEHRPMPLMLRDIAAGAVHG
jgi:hypothetical protein